MKRIIGFIFLLFAFAVTAQDIIPRPNPPRLVNDAANVLSADQIQALESKLVAYDDSTSTQIVVVTIKSLNGQSLEDYALKVLRDWGVGNKNTNNGVVILAAIDDRKIRIEVGYGLEGAIPDLIAGEIIKNEIAPNFRTGNYYRGFDKAADAIIKAAAGEYKAPEGYNRRGNKGNSGGNILGFIILLIIILFIISRINRGGGGGMMSRSGILPWIMINSMMNSGRGGWGGGSSGGGGGFGGFGGGSGGGGGASGGW